MKNILRLSLISFLAFSILIQSSCEKKPELLKIRFVSWNMEHLAENNGEGCLPRNNEDYERLREFAKGLQGDVISLQEVESAKAVARVFPESEWNIVMSDRPASNSYDCRGNGQKSTQQRVAMVIRKGISYHNPGSFKELALDRAGLRYGVVVQLTGTPDTVDVMAIHMKSGCFVEDYTTVESRACETLERQVPLLDEWGENRINRKRAFVIMGDFNNRLAKGKNKFWQVLTEMDGESVSMKNSMQNLRGCHPRYPAPIDHILMDPLLAQYCVEGSETVHYFPKSSDTMTEEDMLSDHCPISVVLEFKN